MPQEVFNKETQLSSPAADGPTTTAALPRRALAAEKARFKPYLFPVQELQARATKKKHHQFYKICQYSRTGGPAGI